jgi:hypothetical protein
MATTKKIPVTLAPTVVKNETQAMDVATSNGRKRPFVAINDEGKMVVCSRRTATKYGWEAQGALFTRTGTPTKKAPKEQESRKEPVSAHNLTRTVRKEVRKELRNRFNEKG